MTISKKATSKNGAAPKAKKAPLNPTGKCLCGCAGVTERRFLPGHDAKLHGMVVDAFKGEKVLRVGKATFEYLQNAFYMKGNAKLKASVASR